jgi:hypothetical protein
MMCVGALCMGLCVRGKCLQTMKRGLATHSRQSGKGGGVEHERRRGCQSRNKFPVAQTFQVRRSTRVLRDSTIGKSVLEPHTNLIAAIASSS